MTRGADLLVLRGCLSKTGAGLYWQTNEGGRLFARLESLIRSAAADVTTFQLSLQKMERHMRRPCSRQLCHFRILTGSAPSDPSSWKDAVRFLADLGSLLHRFRVPCGLLASSKRVVLDVPFSRRTLRPSLGVAHELPSRSGVNSAKLEVAVGLEAIGVAVAAASQYWPRELAPVDLEVLPVGRSGRELTAGLVAELSGVADCRVLKRSQAAQFTIERQVVVSDGRAPFLYRNSAGAVRLRSAQEVAQKWLEDQ